MAAPVTERRAHVVPLAASAATRRHRRAAVHHQPLSVARGDLAQQRVIADAVALERAQARTGGL